MTRRLVALLSVGLVGAALSCRRASSVPPPGNAPASPPVGVIAEVDGVTITAAELDERLGNRLARIRQDEYEIRRQGLDEIIQDRLLAKEAKKRGISVKELLHDEVDNQVPEPDPRMVEGIYEQNKARFAGKPRDAVLGEIRTAMRNQARQARQAAFARSLREGASVKVSLEPPRTKVPVPASAPSLGPEGAPVTIVQFVDYQCPYCQRAESTIEQIMSRYAGKVQLVHRDFPLDGHPAAMPAARASRCAGEQGKFWDYHRNLMNVRGAMDDADLKGRAATLKLNAGAFSTCLASERFDAAIRASVEEGNRAGVNSTPTYFINGRLVAGALPFDDFREVVEAELGRGQ